VTKLFFRARLALLGFSALIMTACTQSTTTTHNGLKPTVELSQEQRKVKILAARKRAAKIKAQKAAEFREARLQNRKLRRLARKRVAGKPKRRLTRTRSAYVKRNLRKKKKPRRAKISRSQAKAKARKTRRTSRGKRIRVKSRRSAFVGGRSRRIRLNAPWRCVPSRLKKVIAQVSRRFGPVIVNSTYRSRRRNRLVGGKRRSYHLGCRAVDFRVRGRTRGLTRWLARHPLVGGYKRYRGGYYHIDTGPKRSW